MDSKVKKPSFLYAIGVMCMVVAIISIGMLVFGASIQIMMLAALLATIPCITRLGYTFKEVELNAYESMLNVFKSGFIIATYVIYLDSWLEYVNVSPI